MSKKVSGFEGLNDQQYKAVTSPINSNIRLLAPPGSGKTHTIKYRYQYLVDNGISPDNILVVTFSKAMADEMAGKIATHTLTANVEQICTIHAFCYRLLTSWYQESPYRSWHTFAKNKEQGLTSWQSDTILEEAIAYNWHEDEKPTKNEVYNLIGSAKYCNEFNQGYFQSVLGDDIGLSIWKAAEYWQSQLTRHKTMTFNGMIWHTENLLLRDNNLVQFCKSRFRYVIIDEGQDTNAQALRILLHWQPVSMIVGDTDQMMFRFQGAKPEIMLSEYAKAIQTIKLGVNYRSVSSIIQSCQSLISFNYSGKGGKYSQEFIKDVTGIKSEGSPVTFQMLKTPEAEAQYIADNLLAEIENGYNFGDFFIGARTRAQLAYLEGVLFRNNIKFINIASGGSFWQSRHVKVAVDYLRLIHDHSNADALVTVYNVPSNNHAYAWDDKRGKFKRGEYCPTRYLGAEFLAKIHNSFDEIDDFIMTAYDAWRYKTKDQDYAEIGPTKAQDLLEYVLKLTEYSRHCNNAGEMLEEIINTSVEKWLKYNEGISEDEAANGKLDDLTTVIDIAKSYSDTNEFLIYVDEMIKASEDSKNGDWSEYAILSTIHRLKGLERPIVFGIGWCEGYKTTKDGRELPVGLLPHTFSMTPPPNFGVLPLSYAMNPMEDERCCAFVLTSRAMDKVYLSGTETYRDWVLFPSRFVREMGISVVSTEDKL